ncbi:DUF364 domain-containing protein [bacterium]|nr:DUF364 domain-containing protein [bacterium]
MPILEDLIKTISDEPVDDIIIGIYATLICAGECGLSSTLRYGIRPHRPVEDCGELTGKSTGQLAKFLFSDYLIEAGIGMAAINASLPRIDSNTPILNAKNLIYKKGVGKIVALIGHFPFVENSHEFKELMVFEKFPTEGDLREQDIPFLLNKADVVAITATSIPNHTFEDILTHCKGGSYKIVLGPTTPLSPILFDYGIDAISGSIVRDRVLVKRQVKEGISFKNIGGTDKVTLFKEDYARKSFG